MTIRSLIRLLMCLALCLGIGFTFIEAVGHAVRFSCVVAPCSIWVLTSAVVPPLVAFSPMPCFTH
jgi:hypothetical protein